MSEISRRRVLHIALPIVLSNATVPILGAVDTGVVGQMGLAAPIGAVGVGAVVLTSIYWIFSFLRMGTSGFVAQARGAGDHPEVAAHLARALLVAFAVGLALICLQWPLFALAFRIAPASAEVERLAQTYLSIRIWGAPATIGLYALTGWLIAVERTRGVLLLQLWMNSVNVLLDLLFVIGWGWGVAGVASATLIAEFTGLALAVWLARSAFQGGHWRDRRRLMNRAALIRMARVNADIMIRSVVLQFSFTAFLFLGAAQGDLRLAANQVLLQFLEITACALDGFAFAAEALVGQAVGARNRANLRHAARVAAEWSLLGAVLLALVFALAGPAIIDLMTTAPEIRSEARLYLPWLVVAPLIGVASWTLDGIFIGATMTREMRNAMLFSVAIYAVALMILPPLWGNHGLWAALMVLNAVRGLSMAAYYPRAEAKVVGFS